MSQRVKVKCPCCEGLRRVAILRVSSMDPFARVVPEMCNRPMTVTILKARELMRSYGRDNPRDRARIIVIRHLAERLETTPCPHCRATGYAYVLTFG